MLPCSRLTEKHKFQRPRQGLTYETLAWEKQLPDRETETLGHHLQHHNTSKVLCIVFVVSKRCFDTKRCHNPSAKNGKMEVDPPSKLLGMGEYSSQNQS